LIPSLLLLKKEIRQESEENFENSCVKKKLDSNQEIGKEFTRAKSIEQIIKT